MIKKCVWDSNFFGWAVGEYLIDADLNFNDDTSEFDLLYVKSTKPFDKQLSHFELSFSETKVVFQKQLTQSDFFSFKELKSVDENYAFIEDLYTLAYESGKHSRFKKDPKFGISYFKLLYRQWIDNSLNRKFADAFYVYEKDAKPIAIITYKVAENFATIGLIAVLSDYQGQGIGKKLIAHVEHNLYYMGITDLRIPTQLENVSACSFYEKMGYSITEKNHIKHYWKT